MRREPTAEALRALIRFYTHRRRRRPRGLRHRLGARRRKPGGHRERLHRGVPGPARRQGRLGGPGVLRQPRADAAHRDHRRARPVVRGSHAVGAGLPQAGGDRRVGARHRRRDRDRRLGPDHAGRHQPAQRPGRARALRQQVGVARQRQRGLRALDAGGAADRVLRGTQAEAERTRVWGVLSRDLATELHEVIGHGSGRMASGISQSPPELLRERYSALEEARSDLVALVLPARTPSWWSWTCCQPTRTTTSCGPSTSSITRGVADAAAPCARGQPARGRPHAQPPADRAAGCGRHTTAIEVRRREGKTYFTMVDAEAFHAGVGDLLAEVQRIKSEGDYDGGAPADRGIRRATSTRRCATRWWRAWTALRLPSYSAFVMPRLDAPAGARRQHRRRRGVLPVRPRGPDAGVLGARPRLTRRMQGS